MKMAKKGEHLSEETKRKMSEARKGKSSWNKGIPHSKETRRKISESQKGKTYQKEESYRRKMSNSLKGRIPWNKGLTKYSDIRLLEAGKNISKALKKTFQDHPEKRLARKKYLAQHPEKHPTKIVSNNKHSMTKIEKIIDKMLHLTNVEHNYQHVILCGEGSQVKFVDFYLPKHKMIIECDEPYWHQDKEKEEKRDKIILESLGSDWRIEHLTTKEIYDFGGFLGIKV